MDLGGAFCYSTGFGAIEEGLISNGGKNLRGPPFEKILMLGRIEGGRRRGQQRMTWLDVITDSMDMSLSKLRELVMTGRTCCCSPWGHKEPDMTEQLNRTELEVIVSQKQS